MKVILCGMALDIGGAETHMAELAKELTRRGCEVIAVSNGGVYTAELEAAGIRHIKLPLHTKSIPSIIRAYTGLARLIRREKPDIVHAHARIPAFICGMLAKTMRFRLVTTVHGTYTTSPLWSMISNWGERSLAPSCDLKQYLIDNYAVPSDNITVTVNGIDTERFSGRQDERTRAETERELGLCGTHRIIHVSRLDTESSYTARALIAKMPELSESYPGAQLIIVGGGTEAENIAALAERTNALLARNAVVMAGRRTDVEKILACAQVFVGVSRAALEAMASRLPVILSGSPDYGQGYGGIFTPDMLERCTADNFCCRKLSFDVETRIIKDLSDIFESDNNALDKTKDYNRETVRRLYSVGRMADDAIKVYSSLTPKKRYRYGDVVISGYYGFNNMGDDSLLAAMIASLRKRSPDIRITVLSKRPRETARRNGTASVNRFNPISVLPALSRAKVLISGGGSLLQNETSARSLLYYVWIIRLAKRMGLKIAVYASGIGPIYGDKYKNTVKNALLLADSISLRESSSYDEVIKMGIDGKKVRVTADPVFGMDKPDGEWIDFVMRREGIPKGKRYFAVSMRRWKTADEAFEAKIEAFCKKVMDKYSLAPLFIPLQPSRDLEVSERLAAKCGGSVLTGLVASELTGILSKTEFAVGMRLHSLIYTAKAGVPFIGISYDPKIDALAKELDMPYVVSVSDAEVDTLTKMADEIMAKRSEISQKLAKKTDVLTGLTATDALQIVALMGNGEYDS